MLNSNLGTTRLAVKHLNKATDCAIYAMNLTTEECSFYIVASRVTTADSQLIMECSMCKRYRKIWHLHNCEPTCRQLPYIDAFFEKIDADITAKGVVNNRVVNVRYRFFSR